MRGRKPKSERLHIAAGTDREDRKKRPPKPRTKPIKPPACVTGEALQFWKDTAPELIEIGVLTPLDRAAFSVLCNLWGDYVDLRARLAKEGPTFKVGKSKMIKRHPIVGQLATVIQQLRLQAEKFGLDPLGRLRLDVDPEEAGPDPFEELRKRRGGKQA